MQQKPETTVGHEESVDEAIAAVKALDVPSRAGRVQGRYNLLVAEIERLRRTMRPAEGGCMTQAPSQTLDPDHPPELVDAITAADASDVEEEREWWQMRARVASTLWAAFAEAGMTVDEVARASGVSAEDIEAMLRGAGGGTDTRDLFRACFAMGFRLRLDLQGMAVDV